MAITTSKSQAFRAETAVKSQCWNQEHRIGSKNRCNSESHPCSRNDFWGLCWPMWRFWNTLKNHAQLVDPESKELASEGVFCIAVIFLVAIAVASDLWCRGRCDSGHQASKSACLNGKMSLERGRQKRLAKPSQRAPGLEKINLDSREAILEKIRLSIRNEIFNWEWFLSFRAPLWPQKNRAWD